MPPLVLLADDDRDLTEGLRWFLEADGFRVLTVTDGLKALEIARREKPDVVILDIMMPGMDGVKVCETLRAESEAFIVMLSARDTELDKIRALEKGADDYVTKPFSAAELAARLKAILRRNRAATPMNELRWKYLAINLDERSVAVKGIPVALSATEFDLLLALMRRPKVVFPREQLVQIIWGDDFYGELRLVDNHIYRLRDKLIAAGLDPCPIHTIRGVGYAFRPEE
ncbi:MAG: response regulator transcription factor [bacterium]